MIALSSLLCPRHKEAQQEAEGVGWGHYSSAETVGAEQAWEGGPETYSKAIQAASEDHCRLPAACVPAPWYHPRLCPVGIGEVIGGGIQIPGSESDCPILSSPASAQWAD